MKRGIWLLLLMSCSSGPDPDVKSPRVYGRYLGALQLAEKRSAASVRELVLLLDDPDYLARSGAVVAMGRMGDPEFAQHLIPHLSAKKEPSGLVRSDVCIALGRLKSPDGAEPLLEVLKSDKDPVVRREAARAMADYGMDPPMILGLVRALMDPDASVAWRAEVSLGLRRNPSDEKVKMILSGRKSQDETVRAGVADAAAFIGSGDLAPQLVPIHDSSPRVRMRIYRALGLLKNPDTLEILLKALKAEKDPVVRAAAVRSLSHFGKVPSILETLLSALTDPSKLVKAQAQQALMLLTGATKVERDREAWETYLKEHP